MIFRKIIWGVVSIYWIIRGNGFSALLKEERVLNNKVLLVCWLIFIAYQLIASRIKLKLHSLFFYLFLYSVYCLEFCFIRKSLFCCCCCCCFVFSVNNLQFFCSWLLVMGEKTMKKSGKCCCNDFCLLKCWSECLENKS